SGGGIIAGATLALAVPVSPPIAAGALAMTAVVLLPTLLVRRLRPSKWLTRFATMACLSYGGLAARSLVLLVAAPLLLAALAAARPLPAPALAALYKPRGPSRSPCDGCPERTQPTPCRGVAPIVRRERAFQRMSARLLVIR